MTYLAPLSIERLRSILDYDPYSGTLTWKDRPDIRPSVNARYRGKIAGHINRRGYLSIRVDYLLLQAHRVAWAIFHGHWCPCELDHRNGDKLDNSAANLRPASRGDQLANTRLRSDSTSGYKGVHWVKEIHKWQAKINFEKKPIIIGYFSKKENAALAYNLKALELRGSFARMNTWCNSQTV